MNEKGLTLLKSFESCKLISYRDQVGIWTIGWGHAIGVKEGQIITQEQADEFLKNDLNKFEDGVRKYLNVSITDNQFSSLVDFSYNLGLGSLHQSTLLKNINSELPIIESNFTDWCKAGGQIVPGLLRRRKTEYQLFISDHY